MSHHNRFPSLVHEPRPDLPSKWDHVHNTCSLDLSPGALLICHPRPLLMNRELNSTYPTTVCENHAEACNMQVRKTLLPWYPGWRSPRYCFSSYSGEQLKEEDSILIRIIVIMMTINEHNHPYPSGWRASQLKPHIHWASGCGYRYSSLNSCNTYSLGPACSHQDPSVQLLAAPSVVWQYARRQTKTSPLPRYFDLQMP